MNKTAQIRLSLVLAVIALLASTAVIYLAFIFPKTLAVWADEGRALTITEQVAANLSDFCRSSGLILLPLLMVGIVGCAVWAAISTHKLKQEPANKMSPVNHGP